MKITGDAIWGLANATPARGQTTTWIRPVQATELVGGVPANVYIDEFGNETTDPTDVRPRRQAVHARGGAQSGAIR